MLVIGALAVTVGAFGPIYLHAADSSVLRSTLGSASVGNVGLTLGASRNSVSLRELQAAARLVPGAQSGPRWFGTPISSMDIGYSTSAAGQFYASDLVTRTGFCSQVATVEGHCPVAAGQVLLSERSAHEIGVRLGSVIVANIKGKRGPVPLLVVGLYRTTVPADGYWWGANYFTYGYETTIAVGSGTALVPQLDSTFTPLATFSHLARTLRPGTAAPMVQVPLVPGSVTQDNAAALATATRSYEQLMAQRYDTLVSSQLLALLHQVVSTQHTMEAIAAAIDVQLLLLAVFALYFVASRTSDEREPDVRLAELRGFRPRSVFGVALAEPLAITLTALPIGLVAAWILARATAPVLFPQGVGAPLTTLAVGTAVATAAVGLAAMAFGARRLVAAARSGGGAEARALQARSSAWRIVAEVAAIGLAAAAFAELLLVGVSGGGGSTHTDPLAALAPGILAVAVGVLGARLVPALTSATLPLTRNAPRVALVLATRRIARAGEFASQVVFVVLAVSLATFGIVGWKVAAYNRAVRSQFDVGADRVLAVQVRPGVNFLTAVRRADGGGRSAMAVMVENASDGVTLAVDSTRMAQVMSWPSGLSRESVAAVAKRLVPANLNPLVVLHGDQVALSITAGGGDAAPAAFPRRHERRLRHPGSDPAGHPPFRIAAVRG